MKVLVRAYDVVLHAMAIVAAAALAWLMVSVIVSVAMRNAGLQPFAWLFTSAEYSLLYMTMLGAPWLVRERGHVHIELVTAALPPNDAGMGQPHRRAAVRADERDAGLVRTRALPDEPRERNDFDVRAYYFPRALLTVAFPLSFGFMAIEFARFVVGEELMHSGEAGIHE